MPPSTAGLPTTYKDFTIKASVKDFAPIEGILTNMNAHYAGLDEQTDYYFETHVGKLKLRQGTIENVIIHYRRALENGIERTTVYRYDKNPGPEQINHLKKRTETGRCN
ncbi:hypothetical protein QQ054_29680 [Oscillatoria amoena NRMC-F 0135]|nr:hypothetical protein [Oscillatoria amoena NRMC-F 0135]